MLTEEWRITIQPGVTGEGRQRLAHVLNAYGSTVEPGVWQCHMTYEEMERLKELHGSELTIGWEPSYFEEPLGAPVEHEPSSPGVLHCTDAQFLNAVQPGIYEKLLRYAGGDAQRAEEWMSEMMLDIVLALRPYWSDD